MRILLAINTWFHYYDSNIACDNETMDVIEQFSGVIGE